MVIGHGILQIRITVSQKFGDTHLHQTAVYHDRSIAFFTLFAVFLVTLSTVLHD